MVVLAEPVTVLILNGRAVLCKHACACLCLLEED